MCVLPVPAPAVTTTLAGASAASRWRGSRLIARRPRPRRLGGSRVGAGGGHAVGGRLEVEVGPLAAHHVEVAAAADVGVRARRGRSRPAARRAAGLKRSSSSCGVRRLRADLGHLAQREVGGARHALAGGHLRRGDLDVERQLQVEGGRHLGVAGPQRLPAARACSRSGARPPGCGRRGRRDRRRCQPSHTPRNQRSSASTWWSSGRNASASSSARRCARWSSRRRAQCGTTSAIPSDRSASAKAASSASAASRRALRAANGRRRPSARRRAPRGTGCPRAAA